MPDFGADFWAVDHIRDALAGRDMGAVVRAYRHHPAHGRTPLPQAIVASWLNITQGQLSRIESGRNQVRDLDRLIHYAQRLRIPTELLWFDVPAQQPHQSTAAAPAGRRAPYPVGSPVSEPILTESLLITLQQYAAIDKIAGPYAVLPVATQQSQFVQNLLSNSYGPQRERLLAVAARFAEFIGWLHQDAGDLDAANHWSNTALGIAEEAGDARSKSYILMRKSNLASDAHEPDPTIALARAALQDSKLLTPSLQAVALRQMAHGYALAGNYDDCARTVDKAINIAPDTADGADIAYYCTPSYIEMEAAHCWIELGRPNDALATLQHAISNWRPNLRRDMGLCLARLAVAFAAVGNSDDAIQAAKRSLPIAAETRSARTRTQLNQAADLLTTSGAPDQGHRLQQALRTSVA